jgi:hypothetical protein
MSETCALRVGYQCYDIAIHSMVRMLSTIILVGCSHSMLVQWRWYNFIKSHQERQQPRVPPLLCNA